MSSLKIILEDRRNARKLRNDFLDFVPWSESGTERGKRLWDFLPAKMLIAGSAIQLAV